MKKNKLFAVACAGLLCVSAAGCAGQTADETGTPTTVTAAQDDPVTENAAAEDVTAAVTVNANGILDTADIFTERDLLQTADLSGAAYITVADGETVEIDSAGVYVLSGTAADCTVRIAAGKEDKIQLVLDNVTVTNASAPAIYVVSADKVFITTAAGSENILSVTGKFAADGDVNTDAVIFSKDDLVLNGLGTLTVNSTDNGVTGKDEVRASGGTWVINADGHGLEANDAVAVCGGSFTVNAGGDAFHAENSDDDSLGWIWIADGVFDLTSGSDVLHAGSVAQVDGGTLTLKGHEGIEATYVQLNGGSVTITADDDGINAGDKSDAYDVTIEINGGALNVTVGQGDTDAIDSNGDLYVNGGTIEITTPGSAFDYDGRAVYTGGTIIINGEQVDSIPQSMMGGMRR